MKIQICILLKLENRSWSQTVLWYFSGCDSRGFGLVNLTSLADVTGWQKYLRLWIILEVFLGLLEGVAKVTAEAEVTGKNWKNKIKL